MLDQYDLDKLFHIGDIQSTLIYEQTSDPLELINVIRRYILCSDSYVIVVPTVLDVDPLKAALQLGENPNIEVAVFLNYLSHPSPMTTDLIFFDLLRTHHEEIHSLINMLWRRVFIPFAKDDWSRHLW